MTIIFSITLIFWAFVANLFKKHINILIILLINSYFLGFIDRDDFGILNVFDLNAVCLIIYIYYIIANMSYKRLKNSIFIRSFIVLLILYIYAVVYPFIRGNSTLFYSFKEGKEFIHYLAFFATYLSIRSETDIKWTWCYILSISIYYGLLQIAYTFGLYKLDILHYLYRKDDVLGIVKVYQPMFSIVFLAMFYFLWESIILKSKNYFQIIFLFLTALLTAFRAYILGSFIALGGTLLVIFKGKHFFKLMLVYSSIIVIVLFIMSITISGSISEHFTANFDKYIFSGIREFLSQEGGSLEGRYAVNKFRWDYFYLNPFLGYGFIDKYSKLGTEIYIKHKAELSFIDTGYLDALNKFGLIGTIIFYGVFIRITMLLVYIITHSSSMKFKVKGISVLCFLITIMTSQVTHAGLTFSFGIIPLVISLGAIDIEWYMTNGGDILKQ